MKHKSLLTGVTTLALLLGGLSTAHAGLDACGNIHVEANAECSVEVEGGCTAHCTPVSFQGACAAELYATCDGDCSASATAECTGSCDLAACQARCEVDPGQFDCQADCSAQAEAHCAGECSAAENRGECEASCQATFSGSCEGSCSGTPPQADCTARCEASCQGSCEAEANVSCQIDCQAEGFVECQGRLEGGCTAACSSPEGALFCDGQYVDHGGNMQACIDALEARLNIQVETSARGNATGDCSGNRCAGNAEGEASANASCGYAPLPLAGSTGLLASLGVFGIGLLRRRRSRA